MIFFQVYNSDKLGKFVQTLLKWLYSKKEKGRTAFLT